MFFDQSSTKSPLEMMSQDPFAFWQAGFDLMQAWLSGVQAMAGGAISNPLLGMAAPEETAPAKISLAKTAAPVSDSTPSASDKS